MAKETIRQKAVQSLLHRPAVSSRREHEPERQSEAGHRPAHDEIAALAYEHWERRGCPIGSAEEDWFAAERELKNRRERAA